MADLCFILLVTISSDGEKKWRHDKILSLHLPSERLYTKLTFFGWEFSFCLPPSYSSSVPFRPDKNMLDPGSRDASCRLKLRKANMQHLNSTFLTTSGHILCRKIASRLLRAPVILSRAQKPTQLRLPSPVSDDACRRLHLEIVCVIFMRGAVGLSMGFWQARTISFQE